MSKDNFDLFDDDDEEKFEDTDPHKLARTSDPETSKAAARSAPSGDMRKLVYDEVVKAGAHGITMREIQEKYPHLSMGGTLSSRASELAEKDLIYYRGDTRKSRNNRECRVMRTPEHRRYGKEFCDMCGNMLLKCYGHECPECTGSKLIQNH